MVKREKIRTWSFTGAGFFAALVLQVVSSTAALANVPPIVDAFVANPSTPTPGRVVRLTINAHDPDCAATCTTGCGTSIRSDLLAWSDNTGRLPAEAFLNSVPGPTGSPWSATVEWVAPLTEGSYIVTATVSDSGGMICGGRKTTYAAVPISVTTTAPPVVDSFTASPVTVPVGGTAQLSVVARDAAGASLRYVFSGDAGTIQQADPSIPTAQWTAPLAAGVVNLRCAVSAGGGQPVTVSTSVQVVLGSFAGWLPPEVGRVTRVAALLDGRLAVVDGVGGTASVVSAAGGISWRAAGFLEPVAVGAAGNEIFVLERKARRISVLSTAGARLRTIPCPAQMPVDLAVGPGPGELTVTDASGAVLHVVSAGTGSLIRTMGSGALRIPSGLAIHQGRIAVADPGLRRVVLFDAAGAPLGTLGDDTLFVRPQGVTWDPAAGRLVVSDSFSSELTVLGEDGSVRGQLGGFGTGAGQISAPTDVQLVEGGLLAVPLVTSGKVALYRLLFSLAPPAPPTGVVAADLAGDDGGAIKIGWAASADDSGRVASYRVERSWDPLGEFSARASVAAGTTSYVDRGTLDGECNVYRVVASDGVLETASPVTPCARSRNDLPPPAPAFASAEPQSPTTAAVAWAPVASADLARYDVTLAAGGGSRVVPAPPGTTQLPLMGLIPGQAYQVGVAAVDTAGNASVSTQTIFSTYPDEPPPTPEGVVAWDLGLGGEVAVDWRPSAGRVPAASFKVTATPRVAGWAVVETIVDDPPAGLSGLVNRLDYLVSVTSITPWDRQGAPSAPVAVRPTAPPRLLAVVQETGWPGGIPGPDASGIVVRIPAQADDRVLKLQYRAEGSQLALLLDGAALRTLLPDTRNEWTEASVELSSKQLKGTDAHLLELRNSGFPSASAVLSLRRVDLVPLPVEELASESYNTVVDVTWIPADDRPDLTVAVSRETARDAYAQVPCTAPSLARCRDTFVPNDDQRKYRAVVVSPAGWQSAPEDRNDHAAFGDGPPPVTDLLVEPDRSSWRLRWTPLSTAPSKKADPVPVLFYRVYRKDARGLALLVEVQAPPVSLPPESFDPATGTLVVRSIDAAGKESQ